MRDRYLQAPDEWTRRFHQQNRRLRMWRATKEALVFAGAAALILIVGLIAAAMAMAAVVALAVHAGSLAALDNPMAQNFIDGVALTVPVIAACMALEWLAEKRRQR